MKKNIPGIIILLCAVTVIVWQAGGLLASRPGDDFALRASDFESFELKLEGWNVQQLQVDSNFMEVNLLKFLLNSEEIISHKAHEGYKEGYGENYFTPASPEARAPETAEERVERAEDRRPQTIDHRQKTQQFILQTAKPARNGFAIGEVGGLSDGPDKNSNVSGLESMVYGLWSSPPQILVRLVHGYNMRDCMRIKGYAVDEINGAVAKLSGSQVAQPTTQQPNNPTTAARSAQLWRITSPSGDTSVWMSGILRAGDFSPMDLSVTDMPFPRVGTPDDPNWIPRGLTLRSLRHPIQNFKYFLRAKWNAARCDLLTFLRLRKPAWASDDALTLLVIRDISPDENEEEVAALMQDIYNEALVQLQLWGGGEIPKYPNTQVPKGEGGCRSAAPQRESLLILII